MTAEQIYEASKDWGYKHLGEITGQEIDDIAMVWKAAIDWYKQQM